MAEPEPTAPKASSSSRAVSRHRECALCLETFVDPRLLPCFHTFCLKCLQRLPLDQNQPRTFSCPVCITPINVPEGGLEQFQVNFYVEAEMEAAASQVQPSACEMCGQAEASHKCVECEQLACQACTRAHSSIKVTKTHTVIPLDDAEKKAGGSGLKKERFCSIHPEEKVRFFCEPCKCIICRDCKLTSHEGHPSVNLADRGAQARQLAGQVAAISRDRLQPVLENLLKEAEQQSERSASSKAQILASMRERAEELKRGVDKCLDKAERELEESFQLVTQTIQQSREDMTLQYASFLSMLQDMQRVIENDNDADLLELPAALTEFFGESHKKKSQPDQGFAFGGLWGQLQQNWQFQETNQNTKLAGFLHSGWRLNLQLENPAPGNQCLHCAQPVYPTKGGTFGTPRPKGWGRKSVPKGFSAASTHSSQQIFELCDKFNQIYNTEDIEMLVCQNCGAQSLRSMVNVAATVHIGRVKVEQEDAKINQGSEDQTEVRSSAEKCLGGYRRDRRYRDNRDRRHRSKYKDVSYEPTNQAISSVESDTPEGVLSRELESIQSILSSW